MKLNMKRAALGLCMAACLFSLSACSKADTASEEVDAEVVSMLSQSAVSFLDNYVQLPEEQMDEFQKQMGKQQGGEALAEGVDSWKNVKDELGALISVDEMAEVEEIDGGYSVTVNAVFEKRNMEFTITTDEGPSYVTSVSFAPEYTLGENMEQAFFNMVVGMGTVFIVLIFISLLIGCFKYINKAEEKARKKNGAKRPEAPVPVSMAAPVMSNSQEEDLADDLELVAVITAAIAASTGENPSGLVVRSIKRAPAAKWKKA